MWLIVCTQYVPFSVLYKDIDPLIAVSAFWSTYVTEDLCQARKKNICLYDNVSINYNHKQSSTSLLLKHMT